MGVCWHGERLRNRRIKQRETGNRIGCCGYLFAAGRTMVGARFIVHSATGIGGWRLAVGRTRDRRARRSHAPTLGRPVAAPSQSSGLRFPFECRPPAPYLHLHPNTRT